MHRTLRTLGLVTLGVLLLSAPQALSQSSASGQKWVTSWTGSVHGPYPLGFPSLPPEMKFAIPDPANGAEDHARELLRMIEADVDRPAQRCRQVFDHPASGRVKRRRLRA